RPELLAASPARDDDIALPLQDREHARDVLLVLVVARGPGHDRAALERAKQERAIAAQARHHLPTERDVASQPVRAARAPEIHARWATTQSRDRVRALGRCE